MIVPYRTRLLAITSLAVATIALMGCSSINDLFAPDAPPPLPGKRIPALPTEITVPSEPSMPAVPAEPVSREEIKDSAIVPTAPDADKTDTAAVVKDTDNDAPKYPQPVQAAGTSLDLPGSSSNGDWPQAGGMPTHTMGQLAFTDNKPHKIWSVDIGSGYTKANPLTAQPVVSNGRVYALDSHGQLSALDFKTGKQIWRLYVGARGEDDFAIGGGVAVDGETVYVTNGYAEILALKADDGAEFWRTRLPAPARAAPTIVDGRVFVMTLDGQVITLNTTNGQVMWSYRGLAESTGVLGAASPAVNNNLVIAPFSSGELFALRAENGSVAWSDNLAPPMRLGGLGALADIRALPVIDNDLVIAMSYGNRMVAIDQRTGSRVWQRDIGGADMPWVAGDTIFVLSKDAQLIALARNDGSVRWRLDLPRYEDVISKDHPLLWMGPIYAGGRLIVTGTDGKTYDINPNNGTVIRDWDVGQMLAVPMIVVDRTLITLERDGTLTAWQ